MKKTNKWFTLIEVIVALSILSIIMISVFTIFWLSADLNNKTDISRSMQENIKNISQILSDDIKNNMILWVNSDNISSCSVWTEKFSTWTKLCLNNNISYYLAKKITWTWVRVTDYNDCEIWVNSCYLVKDDWLNISQLSNSWIEFRKLYFYVSNTKVKKVLINFEIQPSTKKWIKIDLVKSNKINFQTTLSEKIYNN